MAALPYTKRLLAQRVRKHITDSQFASDEYAVSLNEIVLYIDQAAASRIVGQAYANAKIEGAMVMPEAYLITYEMTFLQQDANTGYWSITLPQPPMSLPLGYSITDAYFAKNKNKSQPIFLLKNKRKSFREFMPKPNGCFGWVENNTFWLEASNNQPLLNQTLYIQMPSARTTDLDAVMNMPEDDISWIFNDVIKQLYSRYGMPQDNIVDDQSPELKMTKR